jgi:AraC-like DNA-binding protein
MTITRQAAQYFVMEPQTEPSQSSRTELIERIARWAPTDGPQGSLLPSLGFFRWSALSDLGSCVSKPSLILAAQGAKRVTLGGEAYEYGPAHGLVTALDLPITSRVTRASVDEPYLCLVYELNPARIADLMTEVHLLPPKMIPEGRALSLCTVTASLFDAALRLVRLLDEPFDIPILAPLIERELLYRLLTSEQGMRLRHMAMNESQSYKIARAIDYLKQHFTKPLKIETLANHVSMSVSSLHHHFKAVTSMSPLQYHKQLRLLEARSLLIGQRVDVTSAAYKVGYESPSHFTRDYSRLFGAPPTRDLASLRE